MSNDTEFATWLSDLRQRERRGEVRVEWHRVREPHCKHPVMNGDQLAYYQPASACRFCKDDPDLRAWKDYWRGLGAPGV